jgi:hypothetical protein
MRRLNPSWAALAIATAALFTTLGGPAWAAGLISGSQLKNGSITSKKIGRGQIKSVNLAADAVHSTNLAAGAVQSTNLAAGAVQNSNLAAGSVASSNLANQAVGTSKLANSAVTGAQLANGAVTASSVAPGSLTAADVAPGTFLAATGTAANSNQLGGLSASHFVQGTGNLIQNRIDITVGTSSQFLLDTGLGEIDGTCLTGDKPEVSFTAEAQPLNLIEWGTTFGSSPDINTANALSIGSTYIEPNSAAVPQAIEFQVAQVGVTPARVATVWTTGQPIGGTDCIFTAQSMSTGA